MSVIYGLLHDGEIRYIGKTAGTAKDRLRSHFSQARNGSQFYAARWIRSVDFDVQMEVLEEDPRDIDAAERCWIALLRELDCRLVNISDGGGGGNAGNAHTPEARARIAAASTGRRHTSVAREKMRLAATGWRPTDETRAKLSAGQRRRVSRQEERKKISDGNRRRFQDPGERARATERARERHWTAESRAKLSDSLRRAYAEGRR